MKFAAAALLILAATGCAVTAQIFFEDHTHIKTAVILGLVGSGITGILSLRTFLKPYDRFTELCSKQKESPPDRTAPILYLIISLSLLGLMLFLQHTFGHQQLYWLLVGLWLGSIAVLLVPGLHKMIPGIPKPSTCFIIVLLAIIFVVLRVYNLELLPGSIRVEEGQTGLRYQAIVTGNERLFFESGWYNLPNLGFVPSLVTQYVFGQTLFGVRMASVIMGILSLAGLYLLTDILFGRTAAVTATCVAGISYTHIHFSRLAGPFIFPMTYGTFTAYFLFRSFVKHWYVNAAIAGLLTGIALLTYNPARALLFINIAFLAFMFMFTQLKKKTAQISIIYLIAAFIGLGPFFLTIVNDFSKYARRDREVFVLTGQGYIHESKRYNTSDKIEIIKNQVPRIAGAFHYYTDTSIKFGINRPIIDPVSGAILFLGLGILVFHFYSAPFAYLAIWIFVILVGGGILTTNAPFFPRINPVMVPISIIIALVPVSFYRYLKSAKILDRLHVPALFICAILGVITWQNVKTYFIEYPQYTPMDTSSAIAHFISDSGPDYHYYFLTAPTFFSRHRGIQFIAGDKIRKSDLFDPAEFLCARKKPGNFIFIVTPMHRDIIPLIQTHFPGALRREHRAQGSLFYTVTVNGSTPPASFACIERICEIKQKNGVIKKDVRPVSSCVYNHGRIFNTDAIQSKIVWKGEIYFPKAGSYRFYSLGNPQGTWEISVQNNVLTNKSFNATPASTGWHEFTLTYSTTANQEMFRLAWVTPMGQRGLITPDYFRPHSSD